MKYLFHTILYHFGRYGERPHYILGWASLAIILFALLFCTGNAVEDVSNDPLETTKDYLYFSIVTLTTLGYGDLHPVGWWRLLAAFEAIFGALSGVFRGLLGTESNAIIFLKYFQININTTSSIHHHVWKSLYHDLERRTKVADDWWKAAVPIKSFALELITVNALDIYGTSTHMGINLERVLNYVDSTKLEDIISFTDYYPPNDFQI